MPSFKELDISVNSDLYYEGATINNHPIKVKQYIPIEEKIEIATNVLKNSFDEKNSFANPFKVSVYFALEVIYHYTDIFFTDEEKEDPTNLYNILESNGVISAVISLIPKDEYDYLKSTTDELIKNFYTYRNSVLGILEAVNEDYATTQADLDNIIKEVEDPNSLGLLKEIMTKLG